MSGINMSGAGGMGNGFHSDWKTCGDHRIFIHARDGFPSEDMHRLTELAAQYVDINGSSEARVVRVFFNDSAGQYEVHIASTVRGDIAIEEGLVDFLDRGWCTGSCVVEVTIVAADSKFSKHYDHMRYPSAACGYTT
jgi:hypothetical protein